MIIDKNLRFSDSQAVTTTAFSNTVDLGTGRNLTLGEELRVYFTLGSALTSGGSAIIDAQILAASAPVTIQGGSAVTVTSASPGVVTLAAHGMTVGTEVFLAGSAEPTGMSLSTVYYVSNVTTNTFTLSTTLAEARAGTAINTSSTGTSVTCSPFTSTLGSTGATAFATWNLALTQGTYKPLVVRLIENIGTTGINTNNYGERVDRGRYLTIQYVVTGAALTGGTFIADLITTVQDGRRFYASGVTIS